MSFTPRYADTGLETTVTETSQALLYLGAILWGAAPILGVLRHFFKFGGFLENTSIMENDKWARTHSWGAPTLHILGFTLWSLGVWAGYRAGPDATDLGYMGLGKNWAIFMFWPLVVMLIFLYLLKSYILIDMEYVSETEAEYTKGEVKALSTLVTLRLFILYLFGVFIASGRLEMEFYFMFGGILALWIPPVYVFHAERVITQGKGEAGHLGVIGLHLMHATGIALLTVAAFPRPMIAVNSPAFWAGWNYE